MSTAIAFRFPAGRYHATPWESHVNEAGIEWPPSAWRVLRALIAVWYRKLDPRERPEEALELLIHTLARRRPYYQLPTMVPAHSRHYMPERSGKGERRVLVFDAFGRVDPESELVMIWPGVELKPESRSLLAMLLNGLGYLGRAESWVEARIVDDWGGSFDCAPSTEAGERLVERGAELFRLPVPLPPESYSDWRKGKIAELGLDARRLNKGQTRLLATLPERLVDALGLESEDVRREGWSRPPGLEYINYCRPASLVGPRLGVARIDNGKHTVTTTRLILFGKPLPRIEDAVRIGELLRLATIRKANDETERKGDVPSVLTGHDMDGAGHAHAFYLPEDADGDGHIDHVLVHADAGLDLQSLAALDRVRRIWRDDGNEWRVGLEGYGFTNAFETHPYIGPARTWTSVTPYLHPWYRKKAFDVEDQILRECELRGIARPAIEPLTTISVRGREVRPVHFHRFRSRRGLRQPDTRGSFWRLTFQEPIHGPLALGFGCHFGLGVFGAREG